MGRRSLRGSDVHLGGVARRVLSNFTAADARSSWAQPLQGTCRRCRPIQQTFISFSTRNSVVKQPRSHESGLLNGNVHLCVDARRGEKDGLVPRANSFELDQTVWFPGTFFVDHLLSPRRLALTFGALVGSTGYEDHHFRSLLRVCHTSLASYFRSLCTNFLKRMYMTIALRGLYILGRRH